MNEHKLLYLSSHMIPFRGETLVVHHQLNGNLYKFQEVLGWLQPFPSSRFPVDIEMYIGWPNAIRINRVTG
jgi:hypothetical protein